MFVVDLLLGKPGYMCVQQLIEELEEVEKELAKAKGNNTHLFDISYVFRCA